MAEFSMNPAIARGDAIVREQYKARLEVWERRRQLVRTEMPKKGFTPEEQSEALKVCDKMVLFYRDLLDSVSS